MWYGVKTRPELKPLKKRMENVVNAIRTAKREVDNVRNWEVTMQTEVPEKLLGLRDRLLDILTEAENLITKK